jgi:hypothetical protein
MNLAELQRQMASDIMRPLGRGDRNAPGIAAPYITRNDRLTSRQRLEIYRRSYWYRLLDSLYEDFPGLRAVLGKPAFLRLTKAYLADCPSRSYTMRDLGSRLESWLRRNPKYAVDRLAVALNMIRLEWAHIEAWDGRALPALNGQDLGTLDANSVLCLQPYIRLIRLQYPVDEFRLRVSAGDAAKLCRPLWRRQDPRFLAIHRANFSIYYKALAREEFLILRGIQNGHSIAASIALALQRRPSPVCEQDGAHVRALFTNWAASGWFTRPNTRSGLRTSIPSREDC